jgi:putative ABC transport system permease protein
MVRREAAIILGFALGAGTLLATVPVALLGTGFLHRPWAAGPLWLLPAAAVAAVAFAAPELPARQALRSDPAGALALRE